MIITLGSMLLHSGGFKGVMYRVQMWSGLPGWVLWALAFALVFSPFAAFLFFLKKIDLQQHKGERAVFIAQRLSRFILFCKTIFYLFIRSKKKETQEETTAQETIENPAEQPEKREIELLKSIVKFSDITVKQVMQPRNRVASVDQQTDFLELLAIVRESGFSRLPVYDEDLDNVTGILYVKDLLPHLKEPAAYDWLPLVRKQVMRVPESKHANELLEEFKAEKMHLAVVVDEFGGTSGIVTMEDILEEVTGDIRDEFDEDQDFHYRKIDNFNYLFEGQALLNDVCRIAGLESDAFDDLRGDADTIAGLALELLGDIPKPGAKIPCNGYTLTIVGADKRRVRQVKLTLPSI
jgi:CBS domain containing-hemolysin-like protein